MPSNVSQVHLATAWNHVFKELVFHSVTMYSEMKKSLNLLRTLVRSRNWHCNETEAIKTKIT